jgi:hypothetical protein
LVLWWVQSQLADHYALDDASAARFSEVRLIVDNALLQVEAAGEGERGSVEMPTDQTQQVEGATSMPEDSRAANPPQYTLGQLISDLESSERAYQANQRAADRAEAKHGVASTWWRLQAGALRFQPDPARHSGIDHIEALCDEWGTGLKAENVRKLRGKVCSKLGIGVTEANAMILDAVATALGLAAAGGKADDGASPSPAPAVEDLPSYKAEEQPW